MDWGPLAQTALGGLLALIGGFGGQWWGSRSAVKLEQEVWARDLRWSAHVEFLRAFDAHERIILGVWDRTGHAPDPPDDFFDPLWSRLQALQLVSEDETYQRALALGKALGDLVNTGAEDAVLKAARERYLVAFRTELHLPTISRRGE